MNKEELTEFEKWLKLKSSGVDDPPVSFSSRDLMAGFYNGKSAAFNEVLRYLHDLRNKPV